LSWSGNNGEGWWLVESDPLPSINFKQKIITTYTLNVVNKTCQESYVVENLITSEQEELNNRVLVSLRTVRDRYLRMTDFTQLSDSPISDQSKLDFKNFRQQLRVMFDITDITQAVWPTIPTSAPNITIPPFPPISSFNG